MFEIMRSHYKEARWYTDDRLSNDTDLKVAKKVADLVKLPFIGEIQYGGELYQDGDLGEPQ